MAPHIAFEETGAAYRAIGIDEVGGEHSTEAYRKINPRSKVPALKLDDGTVITENIAVQACIARMYPKSELLPPDPIGEARALSLMSFFAERDWFFERFSTVDAYAFVFYSWGQRVHMPMHELRAYSRHNDRMLKRPAVQRVVAREGVFVA